MHQSLELYIHLQRIQVSSRGQRSVSAKQQDRLWRKSLLKQMYVGLYLEVCSVLKELTDRKRVPDFWAKLQKDLPILVLVREVSNN